LVAQRIRLDTVSSNLANLTSMERDEQGNMQPYQARYVIFQTDEATETKQGAVGVKVASVETEQIEPLYRWQPSHPYAIKDGAKHPAASRGCGRPAVQKHSAGSAEPGEHDAESGQRSGAAACDGR